MEPHIVDPGAPDTSSPSATAQATIQPQPMLSPQTLAAPLNTTGIAVPAAAEDMDTIEPEWVEAVRTMARTYQGDPYNLNNAIAMLRREYLSKRYGKDIDQAG